MRSFRANRIALLGILLAGVVYGSTLPTTINRTIGEEFDAVVLTYSDVVEECYIVTPHVILSFKPSNESDEKYQLLEDTDLAKCRVKVRDLDLRDSGRWILYSVSNTGLRRSQSYEVSVKHPEGSSNSSEEATGDDVTIINLTELPFDTALNSPHRIEIPVRDFVETERCYIVTPDNVRVQLESLNISGIEIIRDSNVACGVNLTVKEELIGKWTLISRETRFSGVYETRLPFTINVTEEVNAIPKDIGVIEGKDLYVRLLTAIPNPETCKLVGPNENEHAQFETDPRYVDTCGFIVRNVNRLDNGTWRIMYGDRIIYSAPVQVTIHTNGAHGQDPSPKIFIWTRDQPVQEIFGSNDAIYCKIMDPKSFVLFEGFGRCNITLPRATNNHEGSWRMFLGLRGRVLTEESVFTVQVVGAAPKAKVETKVTANNPVVTLSCSVSCPYPIRACKFRTPSGRILMANPGVGEDQYTFHGKGSSYESGVHNHDCGIQITNPANRDLGFWRCAIETSNETYYGFLSARWPWGWRDPEVVAGVLTEPTLTADSKSLLAHAGDGVLMSCSVQAPIRYCYFRSNNGTTYNVGPGGSSTDLGDYAGAGLDAGECGIRFHSLSVANAGMWSCHVGFHDLSMPEQRDYFTLTVRDIMKVTQNEHLVKATIEGKEVDYCRFVRIDGFGFTNDAVPESYTVVISKTNVWTEVYLWILEPSTLDRRPWTVVTRITGQSKEISRTTNGMLIIPAPEFHYHLSIFWLLLMVSGLMMIMTAALIVPEKNRRWTYARAATVRNSFRQRFAKKAVAEQNDSDRTAANAA